MTISSCSGCSCGYVKVRDGTSSSAGLLGTYCSSNYRDVVTSNGNHMFVEYYARERQDNFKATVRSKKGTVLLVTTAYVRKFFVFLFLWLLLIYFTRRVPNDVYSQVTSTARHNLLPYIELHGCTVYPR